jgi:Protein of unknown function (DUF2465)
MISDCPYRCLTEGSLEDRFLSRDNKLRLINYLLTELQAAQILLARTEEAGGSSLPPETGAFSTSLVHLFIMAFCCGDS